MRGQRDQNHHVHQVGASNYPSSVAGGPVQLFLPSTASGRPLRFAAPQHFEYEDGDDAEDYKDRERGEGHVSEWLNHGSSGSIDDGHLGPETDRSGRQDESNGGDDGADKDEKAVKRRSSKACDSCRRQKCKCERDPNSRGGQCAHCEALGVECTFKDQSKKRFVYSASYPRS